ncbi:teichoic acid D-Ala incorporation-associated protein DltX [Vagococcus sp. PNs007]|uniref:Teichoic acid D-Ala incorporation-associated protein DltX n=1 Tax=Vagococcus proximus TaxID=2991417 RepID=A0ABT5X0P2_9ENTE|nr:teichoic acid D-Ala incorporation-associated protein DltX [Vagococcus proximus]MDF0479565.1 teichoic acid D-Ala incorporation-associated protein DltX [Vagococcus proximus]
MSNKSNWRRLGAFFYKTILYSVILLLLLYVYVFVIGGDVPDFVYTEF